MDESKTLHVVLFPWLAFGHLIPFFELAKQIARKGHKVSYISTSRNIDRLPKLSQKLNYSIDFVNLSLPLTSGLPERAEATTDVPLDKVQYLKKAFDGLELELTQFLENSVPDWIIYDFTPYWLPPIAARLGISRAFFNTFNAWSSVFFGPVVDKSDSTNIRRIEPEDFTFPPKWIPFPSNIAYRLYEINRFFGHLEKNASGVSDWDRFATSLSGCDAFLIRSCNDLEREWLDLLPAIHQKPIISVGLLPPSVQDTEGGKDDAWGFINNWLAIQREKSVVYVALGTEATPSQNELTELAHGLELSGLPFFWALRINQHDLEPLKLPEGFEERTKNQGIVWTSWAPQLRILKHDSVGVFLTHCGWGSIIEGLQFGKPLVMLPFLGDQALNARGLEEKKLGLEIPRNENDGTLTQNSVAESLKLMMNDEKGKIYWEKANEMRKIFGNRDLSEKYIDDFIDYLHKKRK
ncbi:UDP-glycosyltransferase 91A1 [Capsicum baccatum]|uniref:Glycosyltransferase n=1 Tax=Capsicum baccatum TaxID=33114 RepID=A0A2G2VDY3_CAPBA|nr:UDP-glycosyltransferase 91A1 [Capsicum baccatum]